MRIRFFFIFVLLVSACKKEEVVLNKPNDEIRSLAGFLANNFDFTLFYTALDYTGLLDTLGTAGPFTVLAPDDKAFNDMGIYKPADIRQLNRDSLRYAMAYHILPMRLMEDDMPINEIDVRFETLAGTSLYASRAVSDTWEYPLFYFSGALTEHTDWEFSNGVIHTLEKVMKPNPGKSVQQWLYERPEYSVLVAGLKKFGFWDELATTGPFTVFCPSNERFKLAGITEESIEAMDASKYIGARLFGTYILRNKHYFIRDYDFFLYTQYQYWYTEPVQGDNQYHLNFMGQYLFINGQTFFFTYYRYSAGNVGYPLDFQYSLSVSSRDTPAGYVFLANNDADILGMGTHYDSWSDYYVSYGLYKHLHDNLCENGVVHDLQGVLVLPDEALKN
ncbi:Uncaracterized surface protein containing fasciclin (FAS1) repeats [bacterium A37T11]|nr:Uncaracterized surface protein containing fasciclin (FAS1) repeats [bacterium A37T11]